MKNIPWLIEPVTEDRYVLDEVPYYKIQPLDAYRFIPDYHPIGAWEEFSPSDPQWDPVFLSRFGKEYSNNAIQDPMGPAPLGATLNQMGKSYARKNGSRTVLGKSGVIFWAHWRYIKPCWVLIDNKDTHKLLTEAALGIKHD